VYAACDHDNPIQTLRSLSSSISVHSATVESDKMLILVAAETVQKSGPLSTPWERGPDHPVRPQTLERVGADITFKQL
jgi:hypothetical protein